MNIYICVWAFQLERKRGRERKRETDRKITKNSRLTNNLGEQFVRQFVDVFLSHKFAGTLQYLFEHLNIILLSRQLKTKQIYSFSLAGHHLSVSTSSATSACFYYLAARATVALLHCSSCYCDNFAGCLRVQMLELAFCFCQFVARSGRLCCVLYKYEYVYIYIYIYSYMYIDVYIYLHVDLWLYM